jgi:hypothetical protein
MTTKITNYNETLKSCAEWITQLKEAAKEDEGILISWFEPTKDYPFSIVGGWMEGFSEKYADVFCISKSNPKYAMCVKIAVNEGVTAYTDFELMNMPYDKNGEVDNTCIALEWDDDPEYAAQFFLTEWERIMRENSDED